MYQQNAEYFATQAKTESNPSSYYNESEHYSSVGLNDNKQTNDTSNSSSDNTNESQYQVDSMINQQYQQNSYSYYSNQYYQYTPYYPSNSYNSHYGNNTGYAFNNNDKYFSASYPTYDTYPYQNSYQTMPSKSTTPVPLTTTANEQTTPEKPIMNDSGVDINNISPQLSSSTNTSSLSSNLSLNQSPVITTQSNAYNYNISPVQQESAQPYEVKKPEHPKQNESIQQESDCEDMEDEDEDENEEKENVKKSSGKKSKNGSSASNDPTKPPKPYLEIIANAILSTDIKMMQLHEIYNLMEKKYDYFAKNINKSWRNSVRHNLSLNECFKKAGRGTNGKGNYWEIHPACLNEFIRGNFRRKTFKQLIRAYNSQNANGNQYSNQYVPINYSSSFIPPLPHQFQASASLQYPFFNNTNITSLAQAQTSGITSLYNKPEIALSNNAKSSSRYHPYH
jgi:hypothetical protein